MTDTGDQYPGLPVGGLFATKRAAETQYLMLDFLTHRPAGEQWASAMEVLDAVRRTHSRTNFGFGDVYLHLGHLARANYVERKLGEPEPERGGRARTYYRATSDGTRAYDNAKIASRSPLARPVQKPAPSVV